MSATRFFISAFSVFKFSIFALVASKSLIVALLAISSSTANAFSCTIFVTVLVLGAGEEILPVTVAVWSFINTVTLSPDCMSVVVSTGVIKSEPSILTYILELYSTVVP